MDGPLDWEEQAIQAMQDEVQALRDVVKSLLADALRVAGETRTETDRVAEATRVETGRVQHVHDDEMSTTQKAHTDEMTAAQDQHDGEMVAADHLHDDETHAAQVAHELATHNLDVALDSRDILGQAKGVIMVTLHCTAEEAFMLLVKQSQADNRKVVEIATEIASRVSRPTRQSPLVQGAAFTQQSDSKGSDRVEGT